MFGATFIAIGIAASASTKSQINSFLCAFVISLLPFLSGYALDKVPEAWLSTIQYMSFEYHFNNLARGVIDSRSVVYYLSVSGLALHCALFQLERRRLQ